MQPAQKGPKPLTGAIRRKRQAQQKTLRCAAHRRNIAGGSCQALPANRVWWMFVAQEVRSLQKPVTSEDRFLTAPRSPKRSIIAHPNAQRTRPLACKCSLDFANHFLFAAQSRFHVRHTASIDKNTPGRTRPHREFGPRTPCVQTVLKYSSGQFSRGCPKKLKYSIDAANLQNLISKQRTKAHGS